MLPVRKWTFPRQMIIHSVEWQVSWMTDTQCPSHFNIPYIYRFTFLIKVPLARRGYLNPKKGARNKKAAGVKARN
jgi:hypothetical protein